MNSKGRRVFRSAWVLGGLALLTSSARAAGGTGTVLDEEGRPLAAFVRFIPQGSSVAGLLDAKSVNDGTFTVADLPASAVEVCIQVPGGGYVNPCLWPSAKLILPSGASVTLLRLVAKKGSVVTIRVNDPSGLLEANPALPILVGIFAPGGMYYSAQVTARDKSGRSYSFTIPYGVNVYLFVRSPSFEISDSAGQLLGAGGLSLPLLQAPGDLKDKSFVFSVKGKKN